VLDPPGGHDGIDGRRRRRDRHAVGDAISYFHGPAWYDQHIKELQRSFELVRTAYPLP
jgi:hypothetical protein